ncbi:MAG: family 20 glycosylhydrolase [Spirochaetes bacterium]|nr:family 20 glycosylhydrolase [Spirochaetota bacterium]
MLKRITITALFLAASLSAQGDWKFEMANRNDGPTVTFKDNKFSMGTSFVCVEKSWKTQYFWLAKFPVKTSRTATSLLITSDPDHPSDFFVDEFRFESVSPRSIRIVIDGTLKEERDAMLEYIPLAIPSIFMEGARVENEGGTAINVTSSLSEITAESKQLVIKSRIGTIIIEAVKGPGFRMVDRRAKPYKGREIFIFPVTTAPSIAKGERFHHEMTLTTSGDFKSFIALPAVTPAGGTMTLRPATTTVQKRAVSGDIFPKPKSASFAGGTVMLPASVGITMENTKTADRYASLLTELFTTAGIPRTAKPDAAGFITVKKITAPNATSYDYHEITASKSGVVIGASTPASVYYALATFVQLADISGALRLGSVKDWADFPYRAIHLLADDSSLKLHSLFIRNVFGPLKINRILFECEYAKWPSHPEIHQSWGMTTGDMKALIGIANEHYIEVDPLFQTYGHSEYLFKNRANIDIAEDTGTPYAYNVSNPKTYQIINELFADMRTIFPSPSFLHIGHDEVLNRGKYPNRPENMNTPLADLLWKDMQFYEAYAKKKSLSLMLWQDYLNGRSHPAERDSLINVAKKMDKSAVITVWDYRPAAEFSEVDQFQKLGFRVVGATGEEDINNIINFSRYGKKKNVYGMLHTTWTGYSGNAKSMFQYAKKMWPYVQAGVSFWNADAPAVDYCTPSFAVRAFERVIAGMYPARYFPAGGETALPVDLSAAADSSFAEPEGFTAGAFTTEYGMPFHLAGSGGAAGITVTEVKPVTIPVGRHAKAISFLYTSLQTDVAMKEIGTITVDGDAPIKQPIVVRREIGNIVMKLLMPGDVENGKLLSKYSRDEIYSVAQPVFSPGGKHELWQYDMAVGGGMVRSITLTASKNMGLVLAGMTIIE